jgi:hypothetical protein
MEKGSETLFLSSESILVKGNVTENKSHVNKK